MAPRGRGQGEAPELMPKDFEAKVLATLGELREDLHRAEAALGTVREGVAGMRRDLAGLREDLAAIHAVCRPDRSISLTGAAGPPA